MFTKTGARRKRWQLISAVTAAAALALAGCSSADKEGSAPEASGTSETSDWQTITIDSSLGQAVIDKKPERVVTLGQGSAETAIALGTIPVGMESYPWGADDTGYLPWIHEAVTKAGGELPELFTGDTELDVEKIAELNPDLILAVWSGITQEQFDQLSAIAPTVAYPGDPWSIEWDQQIKTVAKALGEEDRAQELFDAIDAEFAKYQKDEYKDVTFSYIYNTGPGTLGVFYPEEQRAAVLKRLGLQPDPVIDELRSQFDVPGTQSALIGLENADKLANSDLIFTFYTNDENRQEIEAQPLYAAIPAVAKGAVVYSNDNSFVTASSMINPLTVPYALERFVPMIDAAIAKAQGN